MRISDWSSDVCSSDLLRGADASGPFATRSHLPSRRRRALADPRRACCAGPGGSVIAMARFTPNPDQLPLNWSDNEAIELIVARRLAARFEAESFQWASRPGMLEPVMMALLMVVAGLLTKTPTI